MLTCPGKRSRSPRGHFCVVSLFVLTCVAVLPGFEFAFFFLVLVVIVVFLGQAAVDLRALDAAVDVFIKLRIGVKPW